MSDTSTKSPMRQARDDLGLPRERVAPRLDPPISSKTLERWEKGITPTPRWRLQQLARIYRVKERDLREAS
jgi:DNA-binding XRE family transcriptional regulator